MKNKNKLLLMFLLALIVGIVIGYSREGKKGKIETPQVQEGDFSQEKKESLLESLSNKELLDEDGIFAVYLINPREQGIEKVGKIIVVNKEKKEEIQIEGEFSIFGSASIYSDSKREYLAISYGTYVMRETVLISLVEKKQKGDKFCITSDAYFWGNFLIYGNCDTQKNRPWGGGEAPSVVALNLSTGERKTLFQSGPRVHYWIQKIEDNTLYVLEESVKNEKDWMSEAVEDLIKRETKTYNLSEL